LRCLDDVNYDVLSSVVVDLAARRSGGRVATLLPVQIVLRFHRLLGFVSLHWLRLVKCTRILKLAIDFFARVITAL
jgi:hypothetical protein